jgi:hypothetical protein
MAMLRNAPYFAASGKKRSPFAAFAGLKTRPGYAILSLDQNVGSIFTRTHNERELKHDHKTKRG